MALQQLTNCGACAHVPQPNSTVIRAGRHPSTVGACRDRAHPVRMGHVAVRKEQRQLPWPKRGYYCCLSQRQCACRQHLWPQTAQSRCAPSVAQKRPRGCRHPTHAAFDPSSRTPRGDCRVSAAVDEDSESLDSEYGFPTALASSAFKATAGGDPKPPSGGRSEHAASSGRRSRDETFAKFPKRHQGFNMDPGHRNEDRTLKARSRI